jgi:hypothetical protein
VIRRHHVGYPADLVLADVRFFAYVAISVTLPLAGEIYMKYV